MAIEPHYHLMPAATAAEIDDGLLDDVAATPLSLAHKWGEVGGVTHIADKITAGAKTIPTDIFFVKTTAYDSSFSDTRGSAFYRQSNLTETLSYPASSWFQSANGRYFLLDKGQAICVDMFGARGDGTTDDTQALQDAIDFMEFYPIRSRALRFERGEYNFTQLIIPIAITGISFNGVSYWDSGLQCTEDSTRHAILVQCQEFKMFDMSLTSSIANMTNWANQKNGIHIYKGDDQLADVDSVINRCRIAGFYRGVYIKGRSLVMRGFNHIASCDYGIEFDWPDTADYIEGIEHATDELGFRGNIIEGIRFHSMASGGIINDGPNAHKASGLDIKNVHLDIGRRIFKGHLGNGGSIKGAKSLQTPTPILELTGGTDFTVEGIIGIGSGKADVYTPDNLVLLTSGDDPGVTTGVFTSGRFSNFVLGYSEEHALRDSSVKLDGVTFDDFTFHDVGFSTPANWRCMSFGSENGTFDIRNVKYIGSDTLDAVLGNNFSNNTIAISNITLLGSSTPLTVGRFDIDLSGVDGDYTPTPVNTTNVASSTASEIVWVYLSNDLIQMTGRIVAQASGAGNCVLHLPLPVASNFAGNHQASGSFNCTSIGYNIAGAVLADPTADQIEIRWVAVDALSNAFALHATYRVI